jgi:hypothetical protein
VNDLRGDRARVRELLGREPRGGYEIVVRDDAGDPVVLRNAPLLDDGTPMPTRYWLVGPDENRRIGRLEAAGGVDAAEAAVDPAQLAAAHARYAAERDAELSADHAGPRPSGGVGGTRTGVKCLHAHWAWHLAGGDDPVGRWIEQHIDDPDALGRVDDASDRDGPELVVAATTTTIRVPSGDTVTLPWGDVNLTDRWLRDHDPPHPEDLTNALGTVTDHLDDVIREHADVLDVTTLSCGGLDALARVEVGADGTPPEVPLDKRSAEEIFRMLATETARDRAHNPGLASDDVDTVVASCCVLLAVMRRLSLDEVVLRVGPNGS